ncbi:MAG: tetratricopeptide repeat protein [Microcoleus sp.]
MTVSELHKGKQLEEEGKLEEAVAFYRQALILNINNSWAYHQMGEALAKLGQFHEAVTAYRHAIKLKPDFSWSYHHLGDALTQQQQWEESATAFSQAIDLNPEHYGSYVGLGNSLAKLGQIDEAIAAYRRAKELNPDADWITFTLAQILEQKKQSDLALAIANCQRAIELNPDNLQAYYKFLELQPDNCHVRLQLADTLAKQDRLEDAIAVYRHLMELLDPEKQTTSNLNPKEEQESAIAHYQQESENNQDRILEYWKLLELEPENPKKWLQLADALVQDKQIQEAIAACSQSIEFDTDFFPKSFLNYLECQTPFQVDAEQLHQFPGQQITTELGGNITSLKSNQGWVFYSPYINLNDGLYLVKVDFEFPELVSYIEKINHERVGFKFDIVTEGGDCIWYECKVFTSQEKLEFILGLVEATNLEFRFGGTGETFSINYIELTLIYEPATNPDYYSGLGKVLQITGKQKKAIFAHRRAIEMYLSSAKIDRALSCYQKALENLQPKYTEAYLELGLTFVHKGRLNEVLACCESAFDGNDNSAIFYYYNLAIILEKEGCFHEADKLLKCVPQHWQLSEIDLCEYIWKGLNQLGFLDDDSIYCKTEINPEAVYDRFSQAGSYKIIEMESLTDEDILFIENSGLSVVNLKLMRLDSLVLEEFYINSFLAEDNQVKLTKNSPRKNGGKTFTYGDMNDQNNFQQTIVERKYIYRPCPFSGRILKSNNSQIVGGAIFYRFETNQVFYLFAHKWSGGLYGVYFPAIETVVKLKTGFEWDTVTLMNYLKADTVINWKTIKLNRENKNKKIAAVLGIGWANLVHYLWNEVTGIQFLYENSILEKIDKFCVVCNSNNPYKQFNIVDIFSEIPTEKLILFSDSQSCSNFLSENNYLAVRVTDVFIKEELADRIYSSAKNKCSKTVLKEVENAKKHFPLISVNLRSHNKSWISQTEGYANIINKLYQDYPKIGVVFDGSPSEEVIMDRIVNLIPSTIATYNALGDVYERIVWAHAIDTYIAAVGSGLTLVTWITNKPGVAHSNRVGLGQQLFWSEVRENAISPVFINQDFIIECDRRTNAGCSNYDLDWKVIYNEVLKIVTCLTRSR